MTEDRWIVIYQSGQHSRPSGYEMALSLYECLDDARFLVKIKRQRQRKIPRSSVTAVSRGL
ncbi:hypothetical protein LCGC14_1405180 [marine sediment metagenome]|uniref:Uncharacterized protein n=1 Tax=marine sediment metagenome TaxID=412755 RepID=A0A0F9MXG9_9ZZZZ